MKPATRALVRQLYFVDRLPLDVIAAELRLRPRTVRRALVVAGRGRRRRSPPPLFTPTPEDPHAR